MSDERIHRAVSDDGTEIVGSVQGDGPPLVFVHGMMDDGTFQWKPVASHLADRFTCHVMSVRNRGGSGHHEDVSPPRILEDIAAYTSSLGEPVGLVGLSAGGAFVLGVASRLSNLTGVAAYEPAVVHVAPEEVQNRMVSTVMREAEEVQQGRLAEGMRIWSEFVGNAEENAALENANAFESLGANAPADLAIIQQSIEYTGPSALAPSALAEINAPVLLLQGGRTVEASAPMFYAAVQYVDEHVPDTTVHEFPDLGHLGPMVAPDRIAEKIADFFSSVRQAT
jgi:pimeloyl-ACP methyl ester carboxylesterase